MDYNALWAEIQVNPDCAEFIHTNDLPKISGQEALAKDQAIADLINAARPAQLVSIAVEDVFDALFSSGDYMALKSAQLQGDPQAAMVFSVLDDSKRLGAGKVDLTSPITGALLDALQASGLLSQAGRDALTAKASKPADQVTAADISRAVRGPRG